MTELHSKLPPSSAARRMACPGSRALDERYGRHEQSDASKEGTLAHECAAEYLTPDRFFHSDNLYTDEMIEGAKLYAETINRFIPVGVKLHIEERVNCDTIHPDMWGTPDAWFMFDNALHVFDYKFGHTPVDAFENWQLLAYACGIMLTVPCTVIYLHIVQPRDYLSPSPHRMWKLTVQELGVYRDRLKISEALATSPNAELRVSFECRYCPSRHACPALKRAALGSLELAYRDTPQGLDSKAVGVELKLLEDANEMLEYRITALRTEAQHLLQSGQHVDHYELAHSESHLKWKMPESQIIELGLLMGVDLQKQSIITPTQAIKAGMNEKLVLEYSERKQSLKLSKIDVKKAKAVFNKQK